MMRSSRVKDQHIAVFGASGSGKTVLVSSFYGAANKQSFERDHVYQVVADDTGQGNRLRQNFLGMKNDAVAPQATRFSSAAYKFTLRPKGGGASDTAKASRVTPLRFVWHDYPGEWFEEEPDSADEKDRRVAMFRTLLRSDVALLLVDGQKLLEHRGSEGPYLTNLFWGIRDALSGMRDDLLADGPIVDFPRIWVIALSKADLHEDLDVCDFQDLVIQRAAGEVEALGEELRRLVSAPEALSLGEDFLLLSSAKFEPGAIDVSRRVGLDLLLPVAWMLPVERLAQWHHRLQVPRKVAEGFAQNADAFADLILKSGPLKDLLGRIPRVGPLAGRVVPGALAGLARLGGESLQKVNADAKESGDYLVDLVSQFKIDLEAGVENGVLVKDPR